MVSLTRNRLYGLGRYPVSKFMDGMRFTLFLLSLVATTAVASAQTDYPMLRSGDNAYKHEIYEFAETEYRKALEEKQTATTLDKLSNTLYVQRRFEEAAKSYTESIRKTQDPALQADGYFNLGNSHVQQQNWKESI